MISTARLTPRLALTRKACARRLLAATLLLGACAGFAAAAPPLASAERARPIVVAQTGSGGFEARELVDSGHKFFGTVSRGLALTVEEAVRRWGEPNGYILGQEASGAIVGGLRYGEGMLHTRNAGDLKVFWQGPSLGWDFGGEGARTMMLVYNMRDTSDLFRRHAGVDGSAYFIGGFGMTALTSDGVIIVPIRSGVGARLGVNIGYLKFTDSPTWNPF